MIRISDFRDMANVKIKSLTKQEGSRQPLVPHNHLLSMSVVVLVGDGIGLNNTFTHLFHSFIIFSTFITSSLHQHRTLLLSLVVLTLGVVVRATTTSTTPHNSSPAKQTSQPRQAFIESFSNSSRETKSSIVCLTMFLCSTASTLQCIELQKAQM